MAHIAAAFPDLSLGTSVLVLPWYHPLRLAEEIARLNGMTTGTLHLGIGRGTARMEYDAYNVDMNEARARFAECYRIVEKGLAGEPFTHHGRFWKIERPIKLRPEPVPKKVRFYGAIGSPASAEVMGDLGVAPICLSTFPDKLLARILERWSARAGAAARDAILPISVRMFIADTEKEGAGARPAFSYPPYFDLQCAHYESDANPGRHPASTRTSAACSPTCASSPIRASSARSGTRIWSAAPATICRRIDQWPPGLQLLHGVVRTPGTPIGLRQA